MKHTSQSKDLIIAIFDSGVGGLSILETVQERWPAARYVYCSDNAHYPYGLKSDSDVVNFSTEVASKVFTKFKPHILIIACNTISTIALPSIRKILPIPVVGVVPAIKPAAIASKSKVIGLLATPATVKRPYTDQLIADFASDCKVIRIGSSLLVDLAEDKTRGRAPDQKLISREIAQFFAEPLLDTVVLGCTHFSLLKKELQTVSPRSITYIDAAQAIMERVSALLSENNLLHLVNLDKGKPDPNTKKLTAVFTAQHESIGALENYLSSFGLKKPFEFI